MTTNRQE